MVDEQKWQELIEEFKKSGLSQREFALKYNVDLRKLQYRLYKQTSKQPQRQEEPVGFIPVRASTPAVEQQERSSEASLIEVELPSGIRIRFPVETDCLYLEELIMMLSV